MKSQLKLPVPNLIASIYNFYSCGIPGLNSLSPQTPLRPSSAKLGRPFPRQPTQLHSGTTFSLIHAPWLARLLTSWPGAAGHGGRCSLRTGGLGECRRAVDTQGRHTSLMESVPAPNFDEKVGRNKGAKRGSKWPKTGLRGV